MSIPVPAPVPLFRQTPEGCGFLDLVCHATTSIQTAAWEWWADVSFINKGLIVLGIVALILWITKGVIWLLNKVGGWKAVAVYVVGVLVAVLGIFAFLGLFRGRPAVPSRREKKGQFKFGVDRLPVGERRYNPTAGHDGTGAWQRKHPGTGIWEDE